MTLLYSFIICLGLAVLCRSMAKRVAVAFGLSFSISSIRMITRAISTCGSGLFLATSKNGMTLLCSQCPKNWHNSPPM